jgi:catechol 2,3-dioxygenase-like lactoylglutathione lyase family enzyme
MSAVRIFVDDIERARGFYRDIPQLRESSAQPDGRSMTSAAPT